MMKKKELYKTITPLPAHIPRALAIDILQSHSEIITLSPLVLEHHPIAAPRDAAADEYYATWYEITERIQYVPGMGKMGSGKISFKGCFHDVPWGVDTHVLAPAGVDIRHNLRIGGNQPGEPPEARELGINVPTSGLYLREDIQIRCNFAMTSFVKAQLKSATKVLVERLVRKAELVDSGELVAMMAENGKMKTINPADRSKKAMAGLSNNSPHMSPQLQPSQPQPLSPRFPYQVPQSPSFRPVNAPQDQANRYSYMSQQGPPQDNQGQGQGLGIGGKQVTMELPGDYYHPGAPTQSSRLNPQSYPPGKRDSAMSELSGNSPGMNNGPWSTSDYPKSPNSVGSRPASYVSDGSDMRSPGMDQKSFAVELPTHEEAREERH